MIFYAPHLAVGDNTFFLSQEESKHCIKVLRAKEGQKIELVNGKGLRAEGIISKADLKSCAVAITQFMEKEMSRNIHIALAPTKQMERLEWFVEKAVELGISELSFIHCKNNERKSIRLDRIEKIAVSALKQSKRFYLPKINDLRPMEEYIEKHPNGYITHCMEGPKTPIHETNGEAPILIGPEGDFTPKELEFALQHGYKPLSLGDYRLRTETAALYCVAMLSV
jgi:16S rRNA (uracil1498-N3)-methyltransferase